MNRKKLSILVVVFVCIILGGWYFITTRIEVFAIESDTTIEGTHTIADHQKTLVKNGAKVTIDGDLTVKGYLECAGDPLNIIVKGNVVIDNSVSCGLKDGTAGNAISIVAGGTVTFSKDAVIVANGNVQIVDKAEKLLASAEQTEALYEETGKDSGTGPRIGPFVESGATRGVTGAQAVLLPKRASGFSIISVAEAQEPHDKAGNVVPNIIVSGTWHIGDGSAPPGGVEIPKPPKNVHKIVLNFNFGENGNVEFKDFHLVGPSGRDGTDDMDASCNARGGEGEDAFRMRVVAAHITINNLRLELGNGGRGGDAKTKKDCDSGIAHGGDGGEAGNFKMTAAEGITIISFHIVPGVGGHGGEATALGKDGVDACPGTKGGDTVANGGSGGKNKKELAAFGVVSGITNVTIDKVEGGEGGKAISRPGKGGNGTGCNCKGGKGGNANSHGGKGGDASLKVVGGTGEAVGGDGGDADSHGGAGGAGGQCPLKPSGGAGGNGGNAVSAEGKAGKGTSSDGTDGNVVDETGGNGGNGGDGCGPGNGGKGGHGKPNGTDGVKGKLVCPEEKKVPHMTTPPNSGNGNQATPPGQSGGTTQTPPGQLGGGQTPPAPPPPSTGHAVQVINYQGKYLPVDQLIVEDEAGCGANHWHAAEGAVRTTDGSIVVDPGPQCGFGRVSENPPMTVQVQ